MESRYHYLGWKRPFSIEFAEWLRSDFAGSRAYDHCLIWVPSSRAGRHILNLLFDNDKKEAEAFHPPRLVTPAQFVRSLLPQAGSIVTDSQCLLAWKQVLGATDPAALAPVFPVVPSKNKTAWAFTVAQQLMRLRGRLAEDLWDFQKVAREDLPHDRARWAALGELERAYVEQLADWKLEDPDLALAGILQGELTPQPYTRLMVAGVLNLSQRQAACMRALAEQGLKVDFFLPIPEERSTDFDALGRPVTDSWTCEPLPDCLLEGRLQRAPEPRQLVNQILELSNNYGSQVDTLVVGSPERELADYLIERSQLTKTPYYAPEGRPLAATGWGRLIHLIADWQRNGSLSTLFDLLNHSLFRQWAVSESMPIWEIQSAIQKILKEQLLKNSSQLLDSGLGPSKAIGLVRECIERLNDRGFNSQGTSGFAADLWKLLRQIAVAQQLSGESVNVFSQLEEILQELQADFDPATMDEPDYWELLNYQLLNTQFYPDRGEEERPVSGWLELPWESSQHIVLLSLPESQVPGPKVLDSFLTPVLCRKLGLYGPDEQAAFHAFRLRLILESRRDWGRVDILLPDRGLDDSPVLPSRFLFLADESSILGRVDLLLGERAGEELPLPAEFGASLTPPAPPELKHISVTALRAYLYNPFHFYLQNLNRWSSPEPLPREMDALSFGSLAHSVLENLNSSEEGIRLLKEKEIVEYLLVSLDAQAIATFGSQLPVSLQIQIGSLAERLRVAAGIIARERKAGWVPQKVEWVFHKEIMFKVGGVELHGVIDLLEKNEESGLYRIVDYKTSDKASDPFKTHLTHPNARSSDPLFPECDFADSKKTARWKDLQLPLYQKAVEMLTGENASCAYFNLSKAVGEIGLAEWKPTPEQGQAAILCAEAIVKQVKAGQFPIEGSSTYEDSWLKWFGGNYERTLDPHWLEQHGGGES